MDLYWIVMMIEVLEIWLLKYGLRSVVGLFFDVWREVKTAQNPSNSTPNSKIFHNSQNKKCSPSIKPNSTSTKIPSILITYISKHFSKFYTIKTIKFKSHVFIRLINLNKHVGQLYNYYEVLSALFKQLASFIS